MSTQMEEVQELLREIVERIDSEVLDSLSDGGDDWFASEKVNEARNIILEYIVEE